MDLFSKLLQTKHFEFSAKCGKKSLTGWNGHGHGTVIVQQNDNTITFKEDGSFKLDSSTKVLSISNEYIWQKIDTNRISLSHARFGYSNLVKLFDLIRIDDNLWQSEQEHVCVDDLYSAVIEIFTDQIKLDWQILGPKKDEKITYNYKLESI
ncbi:hypothetical protein IBE20_08730 [Francisella tularensis subsp. novicida]|uniref:DUF6314 domain-containing protein n=2 Tax=Francisella tularensis TaxID=263 RepID=A0A6I4RW30_FRATU|nr:DUF6314 family protein [Francisella tularensis]ABK90569.1 hypothetical protein FTN_1712 [Francisella tularensis subsp. novicida U112]AJI45776.1 hypothetical protein AS84_776 [Francisella tularensis subsp. novicida F6168]AJI60878.1 hypothetical protein AW25_276 [Francisella tularensis subsp. novicida U112]AJJ46789.1 hypothetical protein CH70_194 [Francisella tularensis subsp. novicida]APA83889.1 hypothetical protein N894_1905 [Francisella tularensis subsp. novicida PA10-7858]